MQSLIWQAFPVSSNSVGRFGFIVPGDRLRPQMEIEITGSGDESAHYTVVPNSEQVVLSSKNAGICLVAF